MQIRDVLMFKKNNFLLCVIFPLLLSACATTTNYQQVLNHWQGARIQDLMTHWGPPDGAVKLANGHRIYTYKRLHIYSNPLPISTAPNFVSINGTPMYTTAFGYGGQTVSRFCQTWFETNSQGIIVSSQFEGNNCIANNPNSLIP